MKIDGLNRKSDLGYYCSHCGNHYKIYHKNLRHKRARRKAKRAIKDERGSK